MHARTQITLPPLLEYTRVYFAMRASSLCYPTACVYREFAHCFARSTTVRPCVCVRVCVCVCVCVCVWRSNAWYSLDILLMP
jgi:hypothetical protein